MKAISLFSGMGGDTLGLKQAGFNVVAFSENNPIAISTHQLNFPGCKHLGADVLGDITKIPDAEFVAYRDQIDLIFAGFPCQGFSRAGKKNNNDPRNSLFREFLRATALIRPKYIIGENVKGLSSMKTDNGTNYIDIICNEFRQLGYHIEYRVLDCSKYGVPQKRERLFILGSRLPCGPIVWPEPSPDTPTLTNIITYSNQGVVQVTPEFVASLGINVQSLKVNLTDYTVNHNPHPYLLSKLNPTEERKSYGGKYYDTLFSFGKRGSPIHCEIIDVTRPAKTLICTYEHQPRFFVLQQNGVGYNIRTMVTDELKQIQSFPLDFTVSGNTKEQIIQIGNAVPPEIVRKLATSLIMTPTMIQGITHHSSISSSQWSDIILEN